MHMCVRVHACMCIIMFYAIDRGGTLDNKLIFDYTEGRTIPHEDGGNDIITLETVFTFATGADHEPPVGFENQPDIKFDI